MLPRRIEKEEKCNQKERAFKLTQDKLRLDREKVCALQVFVIWLFFLFFPMLFHAFQCFFFQEESCLMRIIKGKDVQPEGEGAQGGAGQTAAGLGKGVFRSY